MVSENGSRMVSCCTIGLQAIWGTTLPFSHLCAELCSGDPRAGSAEETSDYGAEGHRNAADPCHLDQHLQGLLTGDDLDHAAPRLTSHAAQCVQLFTARQAARNWLAVGAVVDAGARCRKSEGTRLDAVPQDRLHRGQLLRSRFTFPSLRRPSRTRATRCARPGPPRSVARPSRADPSTRRRSRSPRRCPSPGSLRTCPRPPPTS